MDQGHRDERSGGPAAPSASATGDPALDAVRIEPGTADGGHDGHLATDTGIGLIPTDTGLGLTPTDTGLDVELLSAQLRADAADTDTFFAVLATKLAGALGERVRLDRRGRGLRRRDPEVIAIEVDLTDADGGLVLRAQRQTTGVQCTAARPVRGIVLSNRPVSMGEWVDLLVGTLADRAARSGQARDALSGLLS